ncbi:MAG TPA: DegT/DnrJ/EryC1/StrS family aminotransferase [Pyrinomonadaceae bacterium]|nr:DegT/DnrJ/EryC1/StrS family aminotransferase [Pyrinomonadaceae bacterium]
MRIPFLDLKREQLEIEPEATEALTRVLRDGVFILGPEVEAFEKEWARFCDVKAAAAVGSGTSALTLALIASGCIRKGQADEVITSPLTAGYTALAIMNAGGVPVFADIDPHTYTLDSISVEVAISERTRAILPVHLYGQLSDMAELYDVADRHRLTIIEDAAQAHGTRLDDYAEGSLSQAAAFSFYPTKNLGACGDGGAVVSNDEALIERIKILRQGGHETALGGNVEGCNSRLDTLQAALLRVKLRQLDRWNRRRHELANLYATQLRGATSLTLPTAKNHRSHVYHLYVVQHPRRDGLRAHLAKQGIETMIHYPVLLHQQPLFRSAGQRRLRVAEEVGPRLLSLPLYPQMTTNEVVAVARAVLEYCY